MTRQWIIVAAAALALAACGSTTPNTGTDTGSNTGSLLSADGMAAQIVSGLPADAAKVFSGSGYPDAVASNVAASCVTESSGTTTTAAQFTCLVTFDLDAPAEAINAQHWQATATASSDSAGNGLWHLTPGTVVQVG